MFAVSLVQELSGDSTGSSKNLQQDVWLALKARKESLESQLKHKLEKLKELCLKEAVSPTLHCHTTCQGDIHMLHVGASRA